MRQISDCLDRIIQTPANYLQLLLTGQCAHPPVWRTIFRGCGRVVGLLDITQWSRLDCQSQQRLNENGARVIGVWKARKYRFLRFERPAFSISYLESIPLKCSTPLQAPLNKLFIINDIQDFSSSARGRDLDFPRFFANRCTKSPRLSNPRHIS